MKMTSFSNYFENLSDEPASTTAKASEKLMRAGKIVPLFCHK
jgi:hypothetical protein